MPSSSSTSATGKSDILMMCWNFPPAVGGIEAVASHIWKELKNSDKTVHVIARCGSEIEEGVKRPSKSGLVRYLVFSLRQGFHHLRHNPVGLLVCPGIVDAPVAWLLSCWFKVPFVLLAHGTDLMREGRLYRCVTRKLFRAADAVAANSQHTQGLLKEIGVCSEKIEVIPPGVSLSDDLQNTEVPPEVTSTLKKKTGPVIMTVGRVIRRKGIGEFIQHVIPELLQRYPDLHYIVVGKDASDSLVHHERLLDQLKDLSRTLGLKEHITFTGGVSDQELHQLVSGADLLVFPVIPIPGDVEGFGIVILEGAIHGVPTVASRSGGIPDAVEEGKSGVLVEPENWPEMISAVSDLLSDPAARKQLGEYAAERARSEFSWQVIGERYSTFFETIMKKGSSHAED